ncbi:MAG: hypothetical protein KJP12_02265 [Acidimicrobiia bacterium]|nr:hypothetical protein [Acidimicrobiia bacterium]NNF69416.1 hypothetical protein [Acidimicrobiia bacterium]NNK92204.1 hypothetical protein [Acidimicrobiia bacterium]NNL70613.1 hypothetical protein [Acidimicrobiia bacterium]
MKRDLTRTLSAFVAGLVLLATAATASWLMISGGVFSASSLAPVAVAQPVPVVDASALQVEDSVTVVGAFQLSQPRDPFRPLITPDSPVTGIPGVGGEPGGGFTPSGNTVTLLEIKTVAGELIAVVTVGTTTYEVGVGDTFAGSFSVVSLESDRGVFLFGDKAFELKVGQQILK